MNILHYALGFPPYRTGGMTKYCLDLMEEQIKQGHDVGMLWPGTIKKYSGEISIKKKNDEKLNECTCKSFEMINPMPVPLLDGIKDISVFTATRDLMKFKEFLHENKIEVIHVHTLMGLPAECIQVANESGISTVFTSHDYFGICPKWGLTKNGVICEDDCNCMDCVKCNETALSLRKIKFLQSTIYRRIKNSKSIKYLRNKHNHKLYREDVESSEQQLSQEVDHNKQMEYRKLRSYYIDMLKQFSILHFNSASTKTVYDKYFDTSSTAKIISITHKAIKDNRKIRSYGDVVNFAYLGPITTHKGYYFLRKVLDEIYESGITNFKLHVYVMFEHDCPYLINHEPYKYEDLGKVMDSTDMLIVPSMWYETFGFTVLEALSYGVPVIVSENVGAKDLVIDGENGNKLGNCKVKWKYCLLDFISNSNRIKTMNNYIVEYQKIISFEEHVNKIIDVLYT